MKRAAVIILALSLAGAAKAQEGPICTDRPTKANAPCTVPPGRVQVETSILGWTLVEAGGNRAEVLTIGSSVAKLGLTDRSDLQIGFTPFARSTNSAGTPRRVSGVGDVVVRYKHRLTGSDASLSVAVIPYVKLPAASAGLGNDKVEGGVAVPIAFALTGPVTMTLGPEVDVLADADGSGRHLAVVNLINMSLPIAPRWVVAGELWTNLNFDPARTIRQASLDGAIVYAASPSLQFDAGANMGLTSATPDVELYAGLSFRF